MLTARLGGGIFSSDGRQWEHARGLLRPQFAREQVSDLGLEERHLQNMLRALPTHTDGWTDLVDLQPLNFRLTIDSSSEFLFGESLNSQLAALPGGEVSGSRFEEDAAFVTAFELSQDIIAKAFRFNDWYSFGLTKEYYEACKVCHRYIDRYVQRGLSHEKQLEAGKKYVFLEALAAQTQDPVEIRDQLLSILVAGRDTTASLLSFLFLVLSQNERVFRTLRQAVVQEFGTYKAPKNMTFSSLKACSYLQWCLNETLRLYPSVPMNSRRSTVDTTLPRGGGADGLSPVFVPKGTEVNYSVYATHTSEVLWGKDVDVFKPERWEGRKPGFEYLPFNGGPRICLGQQFALTEAGYVAVRLLQKFDRIDGSAMTGVPGHWYLTLTGRPKYGVKLRLHAAEA
jgi:cytochrome P450